MPGRYKNDTVSHCFTTTVSQLVHETHNAWTSMVFHGTLTPIGTGIASFMRAAPDGTAMRQISNTGSGVHWNPPTLGMGDPTGPGGDGFDHVEVNVANVLGDFEIRITDTSGTVIGSTDVHNTHGDPVVYVIPVKYEGGGFGVDVVNVTDTSASGGHNWYDSSWHWNGGGPLHYDTSFGGGVGDWVDSTTTWHHGDGGVIITSITLPHDTVIMRNIATTVYSVPISSHKIP